MWIPSTQASCLVIEQFFIAVGYSLCPGLLKIVEGLSTMFRSVPVLLYRLYQLQPQIFLSSYAFRSRSDEEGTIYSDDALTLLGTDKAYQWSTEVHRASRILLHPTL